MLPPSKTAMRSAWRTVESRWAITTAVRSCKSSCNASWISSSVWVSTEEVASSSMRIGESLRIARAMESRCFCPPESLTPRSPKRVPYPRRQRLDEAVGVGCLGRHDDLLV